MGLPELETTESYSSAIAEDCLTVIDFYADWCGPCRRLSPLLVQLAEQHIDVKFYKVNVENNEEVAEKVGITAMPTINFYRRGQRIDQVVGADINKISQTITKYL